MVGQITETLLQPVLFLVLIGAASEALRGAVTASTAAATNVVAAAAFGPVVWNVVSAGSVHRRLGIHSAALGWV